MSPHALALGRGDEFFCFSQRQEVGGIVFAMPPALEVLRLALLGPFAC